MRTGVLYSDSTVTLDPTGLTLRWYYFPVGDKRIRYAQIQRIRTWTMRTLTGKWRLWGSANVLGWAPLDPRRPQKDTAVLLELGEVIKPWFSPDRPEQLLSVLRERTSAPQSFDPS